MVESTGERGKYPEYVWFLEYQEIKQVIIKVNCDLEMEDEYKYEDKIDKSFSKFLGLL